MCIFCKIRWKSSDQAVHGLFLSVTVMSRKIRPHYHHAELCFSMNVYYLKMSAPCFSLQASIVTVIRLVNDAVDTIESEGTMSYLSCVSSLAVPVLGLFLTNSTNVSSSATRIWRLFYWSSAVKLQPLRASVCNFEICPFNLRVETLLQQ